MMDFLKLPGARVRLDRIVAIERVEREDCTFLRVDLDVAAFPSHSSCDSTASKLFAVAADEADGLIEQFDRLVLAYPASI